ncbi:MAG: ABC transporter permease [Ilumatobacteraceae bacterium]|nr:ABC transporter permease [Ilumatobacteraceae bacterium]
MIWRRLLAIIPLVLVVSFLVFLLTVFLPGDEAVTLAGENASAERVEEIRQALGLDEPLPVRYVEWVGNAVQGDLGRSLFTKREVTAEIASRWIVTLQLVIGSLVLALLVGVPAGIIAGRSKGKWPDRVATLFASFGVAVPSFVVGLWLIVVFAAWLDLVPFAGFVAFGESPTEWAKRMILPMFALSGVMIAELTRQIRAGLVDTLETDYIRTARAKGLPERTVVNKHALRVAISPALAVVSVNVARSFGGAVVIEQVFALPGLGRLTVNAIIQRDLPILQGVIPIAVLVAVVMTLISDVINMKLNPRLRFESK